VACLRRNVTHHDLELLAHISVALGLCFVLGFEREVRGADAGDRTFSLVGVGAAAITSVTVPISPNAVAGIVTGIGFIGAGVMFRAGDHILRGLTTAATIWAAAAIGVVAGLGHLLLATILSAFVLVDLELRYIPGLRSLDARRWRERFTSDLMPPAPLHRRKGARAQKPGTEPPTVPYD
jgi:putative Mg2+ transporter-C (MgtC) family protein